MNEIKRKTLKSGFPYVCVRDRFVICGQIQSREDLKEFKKEGFDLLINLRNKEELTPLDMEQVCMDCQCDYAQIPIRFFGEIKKEAVREVSDLILKKDKKVLLHCASGARSTLSLLGHLHLTKDFKKKELESLAEEIGFENKEVLFLFLDLMCEAS